MSNRSFVLQVVTTGSSINLPPFGWWALLENPPIIAVKNLTGDSLEINADAPIDSGASTATVLNTDSLNFALDKELVSWVII